MTASTSCHLHGDSVQRALDHYFNPTPEHSPGMEDMQLVVARDDLSPQAAAEQVTWLLRCASNTAYEAAQRARDKAQDQALMSMHLINLARALLDHSQAKKDEEKEKDAAK